MSGLTDTETNPERERLLQRVMVLKHEIMQAEQEICQIYHLLKDMGHGCKNGKCE
jgi:hypothetical protein